MVILRLLPSRNFLFALLLSGVFSSCSRQEVKLPYCEMHEADQSFVNTDKSDMHQFMSDREKRMNLIEKNFDLLLKYAQEKGFPYVETNMVMEDSCKYWAVTMTMLHTAQTRPSYFFSKEMSLFLKEEMDKENIGKTLLEQCLTLTINTATLSEYDQYYIDEASKLWGIVID